MAQLSIPSELSRVADPPTYQILRPDGVLDRIAGRTFASYDAAHQVLERYYQDSCCSDDVEVYRIVAIGLEQG